MLNIDTSNLGGFTSFTPQAKTLLSSLFFQFITQTETQSFIQTTMSDLEKGKRIQTSSNSFILTPPTSPQRPHVSLDQVARKLYPESPIRKRSNLSMSDNTDVGAGISAKLLGAEDSPLKPEGMLKCFPREAVLEDDLVTEVTGFVELVEASAIDGLISVEIAQEVFTDYLELPGWIAHGLSGLKKKLNDTTIPSREFLEFCTSLVQYVDEPNDRFFYTLLTGGSRRHLMQLFKESRLDEVVLLEPKKLLPFMFGLVKNHVGLDFLQGTMEFQSKYAWTIIVRIFLELGNSSKGLVRGLSLRDFRRRPDFLSVCHDVDRVDDINKITEFFNYEHFYVLYCKFWELDTRKKFKLTKVDFKSFESFTLSDMLVNRIFRQELFPFGSFSELETFYFTEEALKQHDYNPNAKHTEMHYSDWCYFFLMYNNSNCPIAKRFFFNALDVEGYDRLITMSLQALWRDLSNKIADFLGEQVHFQDVLCQAYDMLGIHEERSHLTVEDIVDHPYGGDVLSFFYSANKFVDFECQDPIRQRLNSEDSDWTHYCRIEYERLAAEEESN
ncbi:hypothetical protein PCE1_004796 [Barthelona sp. PCE]